MYIDLSHTIVNGLVTYKGLPAPLICDFLSRPESRRLYKDASEFHIAKIDMVANTGTYIDCPFHRFEFGEEFPEIPVASLSDIPAVCLQVPYQNSKATDLDQVKGLDINNKAVLLHTGWSEHWDTEAYFEDAPYLTASAALYFRDQGVKLVGIDSLNIDRIMDLSRPVHTILLGSNIPIVEHLCNLESLPDFGFTFSAVPPKIRGVGSFPVRAYARVS